MAGIVTKTIYQTADGQQFETEQDAQTHEKVVSIVPAIKDYVALTIPEFLANGRQNPQRARAINTISGWVEHQARQGV